MTLSDATGNDFYGTFAIGESVSWFSDAL